MASGWLSGNCTYAMSPLAWSRGNTPADFVSGGIPTWPTGIYQPVYLSGFNAGEGYISGTPGFGHVLSPANTSGRIVTNHTVSLTNTSVFYAEFRIHYEVRGIPTDSQIGGVYEDATNRIFFGVLHASRALSLRTVVGGSWTNTQTSNNVITNGLDYTLGFLKDSSSKLRIFINGAEPTYFAGPDTYSDGNKTFSDPFTIFDSSSAGLAPLSGDCKLYSFAWYDDVFTSGDAYHNALNCDYGFSMTGTSGGVMGMSFAPLASGVDASGISLPTMGYGAALHNIGSFGYGGDIADTTTVSNYYAAGKDIVPIGRESSGPLILMNQGDGNYTGKYYVTVAAETDSRPLEDVYWTFYGENVANVSGTTLYFKLHPQATSIITDKFGRARCEVDITLASGLADLYDKTGVSGHTISMWAVGDTEYITNRMEIEYRVVD